MSRGTNIIALLLLTLSLQAQNTGVGTLSPSSTLEVNGSFATKVTTITGNTTLTSSDAVVFLNSVSDFTVTLPSAIGINGRIYTLKNINSNIVTITTSSGQTIDGSSNKFLSFQYSSLQLVSNGSNWYALNEVNSSAAMPASFLFATDLPVGVNDFVGLGTGSSDFLRNTIVSPFNCELTSITFSIRENTSYDNISARVWKNNVPTTLSATIIDGSLMLNATGTGSEFISQGDLISIEISWPSAGVLREGVAASVTYR